MAVEYFKALWGMEGTFEEKIQRIEAQGYDGFEAMLVDIPIDRGSDLLYIGQIILDSPALFREQLEQAMTLNVKSVTVHAGKSAMSFDQGLETLQEMLEIAADFPVDINFETHRGRLLYEPNSTAEYLRQLPDLYLVADFSHWTVVTESMLGDYNEPLKMAQQRTRHIHARVGFSEAPQVPDARLPKWAETVEQFSKWWDPIVAANPNMTVDPEFGPPDYQWTDSQGNPLSNVEEVSLWMTQRLRQRWS